MTNLNSRRRVLAALSSITLGALVPRIAVAKNTDDDMPQCLSGQLDNASWAADWDVDGAILYPRSNAALETSKDSRLSSNVSFLDINVVAPISWRQRLTVFNIPLSFTFDNTTYYLSQSPATNEQDEPLVLSFNKKQGTIGFAKLTVALFKKGIGQLVQLIDHEVDNNLTTSSTFSSSETLDLLLADTTQPLTVVVMLGDNLIQRSVYATTEFTTLKKQALAQSAKQEDRLESLECTDTDCFITTAVCSNIGLSDNCWELGKLRQFRDTYLLNTHQGRQEVQEYYQIAPAMVNLINQRPNQSHIYRQLYWRYILPCAIAIKCGANSWPHNHYKRMLQYLHKVTT